MVTRRALDEMGLGTEVVGSHEYLVVLESGENDDSTVRKCVGEPWDQVEPVLGAQPHVDDNDIGTGVHEFLGTRRVGGDTHHLEIGLVIEGRGECLTEDLVVVTHHDANGSRRLVHVGHPPMSERSDP